MFSGFQNFERRDANGNGRVVGSDASSRTSNASEVFTDDAVVNPRRLLAVQCGRVPREGASPMAPKRCWFSPTAVVPLPRPQSLDSFFKTRRFITPQPQIPRFYDTTVAVRAVPISVHDIIKKFSLGTNHLTGGSCLSNNPTGHFTTRAPARGAGFIGGQKRFNPRICRWRRRPRLERTEAPSWARRSAVRTTRPEISRERIGPRR